MLTKMCHFYTICQSSFSSLQISTKIAYNSVRGSERTNCSVKTERNSNQFKAKRKRKYNLHVCMAVFGNADGCPEDED